MDKPNNFIVIGLVIAGVFALLILVIFDSIKKNKKRKRATLAQKLYHGLLFETPGQRGGFDSQDRT